MKLTGEQLKALRQIAANQNGEDVIINREDAEECCNQGWADSLPTGAYCLTSAGRELLSGQHTRPEEHRQ